MKTRTKNLNIFLGLSFPILLAIFCSGCRTVGEHAFPSYPSVGPLYKGTSGDIQSIGSVFKKDKDFSVMARIGVGAFCCLDLPLSLGADTLWFPFDLYDYHLQLEEANLLKGWTFKQYGRDRVGNVIDNDCNVFLKQNNLDSMGMVTGFYKNEKGRYGVYAVEFEAMPRGERDSYHYYLFYDKNGKRIKVKKYYYGHYSC